MALEAAGLLGVVEVDGRATVHLPVRADVGLPGRWEEVRPRDWNAQWKAGIAPVTVGAVTIVPPWLAAPDTGPGSVVLRIEPAQAFGTGHHETTTGCMAALQEIALRGRTVLDVGTGTGVLALTAAKLGAGRVVAVDVDPLAVVAARANAQANGVRVDVRPGSADAVEGRFDVVVANLDTATLSRLAPVLEAMSAPAGSLSASGVATARRGDAEVALRDAGMAVRARAGREWTVLLARVAG